MANREVGTNRCVVFVVTEEKARKLACCHHFFQMICLFLRRLREFTTILLIHQLTRKLFPHSFTCSLPALKQRRSVVTSSFYLFFNHKTPTHSCVCVCVCGHLQITRHWFAVQQSTGRICICFRNKLNLKQQ